MSSKDVGGEKRRCCERRKQQQKRCKEAGAAINLREDGRVAGSDVRSNFMKKRIDFYRKKEEERERDWDEEYIRRAEELEREIFADKSFEDYCPTKEQERASYQRLIQELKDRGVYRETDAGSGANAGANIGSRGRVRGRMRGGFGKKVAKVAGVVILCGACVFAASMTSEANRNYLVERFQYLTGNDTKIITGNDKNNEDVNMDEHKAIEDIEKKLNVDMPEFYYRPQGFNFMNYDVSSSTKIARIEYQYQGNIIAYIIDKQGENVASKITSMHGKDIETITLDESNIEIAIEKVQGKNDKLPSYNVQWQVEDVVYYLSGKIELNELKKIMEQMKV